MNRRVLPAFLTALLALPAQAAYVDLGAGARAPGMGNAFTSIADDVYAVMYNPAGLAQLDRPQVSASYSKLYMGLSDGSNLGTSSLVYAHPLKGGRWGTLGGAWQDFSLSGLYSEKSLDLAWGRKVWASEAGGNLLAGVTFKYLMRSFTPQPEAANALNKLAPTGQADPVLSGSNSSSAIDADLGFLYRFPSRFQVGLMVQHANEPDVGFSGTDKVGRNIRLAGGYRTLWMNLASEIRLESAPDGSTDKDIILAAERFFPSLDRGQFGIRGSLGMGSREWRQVTMGLSYRINKIQTDYAFLMPLGTVSGTAGTHRIAMTFHFGAPSPEEQITQDLLTQARLLREGRDDETYGYEFSDALRPRNLDDKDLTDVKLLVGEGRFRKAHQALLAKMKNLSGDKSILRLSNRLSLTSYFYEEITEANEKWERGLRTSILHFLYGRDRKALLFGAYAISLRPNDPRMDNFISKMEEGVGLRADRLPKNHPRSYLEELLHRVEFAYNRGEQEKVLGLMEDVLELEPKNVLALERVGTTYFVLKRYKEALAVWERALPLEVDPKEQAALQEYMRKAREAMASDTAPQPAPVKRVQRTRKPRTKVNVRKGDPRDIARLYQKGVEHYMRGEHLQATAMFMRILQIDPNNLQAKKALERLRRRQ